MILFLCSKLERLCSQLCSGPLTVHSHNLCCVADYDSALQAGSERVWLSMFLCIHDTHSFVYGMYSRRLVFYGCHECKASVCLIFLRRVGWGGGHHGCPSVYCEA